MSDLYNYWSNLNQSEREVFAADSNFSVAYINTHLIHKRKVPPLSALKRLADASNGELTYHGLCDFFIEQRPEEA